VLEGLRRLPTTSARDTTRVAASSPAMWRDIFIDNRAEVLPLIERWAATSRRCGRPSRRANASRIESLLTAGKTGRDRLVPG
jgi:prephenate dehydrogenase